MRITDTALVAAATAIYMRHNGTDWDGESAEVKGMFLRDAQAALEAASPLLLLELNRQAVAEELATPLAFQKVEAVHG